MKVLITGANGFIGKNLCAVLGEQDKHEIFPVTRETATQELAYFVSQADAVIHLAGVNRPNDSSDYEVGNAEFTQNLCNNLLKAERSIPVAFASSVQAEKNNPYGMSKRAAEQHLIDYANVSGAGVGIYRLPNVFGKWCRPNYNSAVATFCHNISRGLPVRIDDPGALLKLIYIDDVVDELLRFLANPPRQPGMLNIGPVYTTTVGDLAHQIEAFKVVRTNLVTERVGEGLVRALYATYVSHLPVTEFSYSIPKYGDSRGVFVEMLKTKDSGQVSFFTAHPGVTRGGHYHHSKTEKFLVIKGEARFCFRHILTNESYMLETRGEQPAIVETIPGWAHDITNIGGDEMVVMLWANEIFDRERPDTFACVVTV